MAQTERGKGRVLAGRGAHPQRNGVLALSNHFIDFEIMANATQDPRNRSFKVNRCQVFRIGHCEMPRLKNPFRCGDLSLKTTKFGRRD